MTAAIASAEHIPYIKADEAYQLMQTAFERLMRLLESLDPEDWSQPTACTEWNVRDIVAHQAGGYTSGASYGDMLRQYVRFPKPGQLPEDAINTFQVMERAQISPADLINELRQSGYEAIFNWAYGFRAIKWIALPHPVGGLLSLRYLMWVIHSRDTWMHRLDICRATKRPFEQTREHDGRIIELVVLDIVQKLRKKLGERAIMLVLTGTAGGKWKIGRGKLSAEMEMDALDFSIFVSGRYSNGDGLGQASLSGDRSLVESAFKDLLVLF